MADACDICPPYRLRCLHRGDRFALLARPVEIERQLLHQLHTWGYPHAELPGACPRCGVSLDLWLPPDLLVVFGPVQGVDAPDCPCKSGLLEEEGALPHMVRECGHEACYDNLLERVLDTGHTR